MVTLVQDRDGLSAAGDRVTAVKAAAIRVEKSLSVVPTVKGAFRSMSVWDTELFANDVVLEFFDEVQGSEPDERAGALIDAGRIGLDSDDADEIAVAVAAAVIIAIWNGAPFVGGDVVEDYTFIREGIASNDDAEEEAVELAAEVFDSLLEEFDESTQATLQDFVEQVQ